MGWGGGVPLTLGSMMTSGASPHRRNILRLRGLLPVCSTSKKRARNRLDNPHYYPHRFSEAQSAWRMATRPPLHFRVRQALPIDNSSL